MGTYSIVATDNTPSGAKHPLKAAVIDLGFNSVKMVSYNVDPAGQYRAYQQLGYKVRLGEGLSETGFLGDEPIRRTIERLLVFRDLARLESITQVLPVATSAVREAANRDEFLNQVRARTGYSFKVLSEREEALYSYAGAVGFAGHRDVVFFDLGGGSLEIVRAVDFRVTKMMSLPLGALRLGYSYGRGDGTFSKAGFERLKECVQDLLPSRRDLRVARSTKLIGVGGTVRAMARYDQVKSDYPFNKVHNYRMSYGAVSSMSRGLLGMSGEALSDVNSVGNRAQTIAAGAHVVRSLMKIFGFGDLTVSTHGLREGTLCIYMNNQKGFHSGRISQPEVERLVRALVRAHATASYSNIRAFESVGVVDEHEAMLLEEAQRLVASAEQTTNLQMLFFSILGEDSKFGHSDQLLMALAVIYSQNERAAEFLLDDYRGLLGREERKSLKRLSALFTMTQALRRTGATIRLQRRGSELKGKVSLPAGSNPSAFVLAESEVLSREMKMNLVLSFKTRSPKIDSQLLGLRGVRT